jgi:hypothetical protein
MVVFMTRVYGIGDVGAHILEDQDPKSKSRRLGKRQRKLRPWGIASATSTVSNGEEGARGLSKRGG